MSTVQVAISQDFLTAFANIPRSGQRKVNEFVRKFRHNPRSSGINYEKIRDAANENYRSVRIDQAYRGIVLKPEQGSVFMLLWVDRHDAAYDWAQRHQCAIHPHTGTLQVYETVRATAQHTRQRTHEEPKRTEALFHTVRERELYRLGVPRDRLAQVRALRNEEALEAIRASLPIEAFEALSFLAAGLSLEEVLQEYAIPDGAPPVDIADFSAALRKPESQRMFELLENDEELQHMLEAPLAKWRVFLHPRQRNVALRHWNGPLRVLGGAGTGKTVVAMHRARWLIRNVLEAGEKLLFTTFSRNLATDIEAQLRSICKPEDMQQIEVTNLDRWVYRFFREERISMQIVYPGDMRYDTAWDRALQLAPDALNLPESFYGEEWSRVILPQQILTRGEYSKAQRAGRGTGLTRRKRAEIWPVFEEMRLQLHQQGLTTAENAMFLAIERLQQAGNKPRYRAAVVDEAQDFGPEAFKLLAALVPPGEPDNLTIVGDAHQRIYNKRASLSSCGINIIGRGRKLRINYRTSEQIRDFAVAVLAGATVDDLDDGVDEYKGYRSLFSGAPPEMKGFVSAADEAAHIVRSIRELMDAEALLPSDICIAARTRNALITVRETLTAEGLETHPISRKDAEQGILPGIRIATMHRVKGLEFKVMFLVDVSAERVPLQYRSQASDDITVQREHELAERALLHVAASRAINKLYVSWRGEPSPFLCEGVLDHHGN